MSLTQVFGWHGVVQQPNGSWVWVHVPQETHENRYPESEDGRPYHGDMHTQVEVLETHLVTKIDGKVITDTTVQHLTCRDCGAEQ
jgi:hypothetical protein